MKVATLMTSDKEQSLRAKRAAAQFEIEQLAQQHTKESVERLSYWARQSEDGMAAVNAILVLHEIAWGGSRRSSEQE